jgi:hypothetical protein
MRIVRFAQSDSRTLGVATWLAVALGIALRCIGYFRRDILWLDEAATARNIVERSLSQLLLVPLDYGQAAPKGFLLLEWLSMRLLGPNELAFRLVPFLSGVASVFLFRAVARRLLSPAAALAAVLFFGVGYWFVLYATDLHPYGLDLALSLAALVLALDVRRDGYPARQVWAIAAFGAVAVWLSNGVVLTLFGLGAALGVLAWRERGLEAAVRALAPIALGWGISAAGAVLVAKHSFFPQAAEFFAWVWQGGMVPIPRSVDSALWLFRAWRSQLSLFHGWNVDNPTWTSLYVCLALIGFVSVLIRRTADAILAGSIIAAYVVVSMTRQYPYDARFVLAPLAIFMLGIGESIGVLAAASWRRLRGVPQALAVALCIPPVARVITYPPPHQWTVTGSYLAQIRERWQPGDVVYTTYGRSLEVMQSASRFGLTPRDYIAGPCNFADPRVPLRAIEPLRGKSRVWAIVGSGVYFPLSPEYGYLRTIGIRRDSLAVELPGSIRQAPAAPFDIGTAYLFDLSDSTRLARATAETYQVSPLLRRMSRGVTRWNCYGVWSPNVKESGSGKREAGSGKREAGRGKREEGTGTGRRDARR